MEGDTCGWLHSVLVTSCTWRGKVGSRAVLAAVALVGGDDSGGPVSCSDCSHLCASYL